MNPCSIFRKELSQIARNVVFAVSGCFKSGGKKYCEKSMSQIFNRKCMEIEKRSYFHINLLKIIPHPKRWCLLKKFGKNLSRDICKKIAIFKRL